jgi:hypothetical protein
VEKRGGESDKFEEYLVDSLPSNNCIESRIIIKIIK